VKCSSPEDREKRNSSKSHWKEEFYFSFVAPFHEIQTNRKRGYETGYRHVFVCSSLCIHVYCKAANRGSYVAGKLSGFEGYGLDGD
jgi:hypothetical protein